jgi:hypothetical protein
VLGGIALRFDQGLQLAIEGRFGGAPECGVDVAEVAARIGTEPRILDRAAQVHGGQLRGSKPARHFSLHICSGIALAVRQAV